jgi:hypothetical protein
MSRAKVKKKEIEQEDTKREQAKQSKRHPRNAILAFKNKEI